MIMIYVVEIVVQSHRNSCLFGHAIMKAKIRLITYIKVKDAITNIPTKTNTYACILIP